MTSTSFNVGLTDNTRLSSRVLRPPGGGHTDIFGGEPEPTPRGRRFVAPANGQSGQGDEAPKANNVEAPSQNGQEIKEAPQQPQEAPQPPPPEPKPQESKPQESKAESPKAVTPTEPKTEAPKRVRVPPGGFSSGLW